MRLNLPLFKRKDIIHSPEDVSISRYLIMGMEVLLDFLQTHAVFNTFSIVILWRLVYVDGKVNLNPIKVSVIVSKYFIL